MRGLDLRKFKKVASDKDKTVMKHDDGHTITVVHKPLSKGYRSQLEALPMAEGGQVMGIPDNKTAAPPIPAPSIASPDEEKKDSGGPDIMSMAMLALKDGGLVSKDDITEAPTSNAAAMQAGFTGQSAPAKKKDQSDSYSSTPITRHPSPDPDAAKKENYQNQAKAFNKQLGGYADGGEIKDIDLDNPQSATAPLPEIDMSTMPAAAPESDVPFLQRIGHKIGSVLPAAYEMAKTDITNPLVQIGAAANAAGQGAEGLVQGAAGQPLAPIPSMEGGTEAPAASPVGPPVTSQVRSASPDTSSGTPDYIKQGLKNEMAGLQHKFEAEKMAGEGKTTALEANLAEINKANQDYEAKMAGYQAERQAAFNDLKNQHIDPNHFWNSKDTVGKIGTVLGMIIGGFGGTAGAKQVGDFVDNAIDRDLQAQKQNIENKRSVMSALRDQFQDTNTAAQFHRVLMNDQVSHAIDLAQAKATTPMAKANLEMEKGRLQKQNGVLMAQIGAEQTLNGSNTDPNSINRALNTLRMLDPAKAKEAEQRVVPGIGVATTPVNDKTREAFAAGHTFVQQMDQLEKFRQQHRGAMIGAAADEGHRLAELARNSFRIAQSEGVFKEGSRQFNEKLIPDPTDLDFFKKNQRAYSDMKSQAIREVQDKMTLHGIRPFQGSLFKPAAASQGSGFVPKSFKPNR